MARTTSSTKRGCRCACSTTKSSSGRLSSSKIGELIERSTISTRSWPRRCEPVPTKSVPLPRWLWVAIGTSSRIRSTSPVAEAGLGETHRGMLLDEALRAWARGDAGRLDADCPPRSLRCRTGNSDQRHELLSPQPCHRRQAFERVARGDPHLGTQRLAGARGCAPRCARRAARRGAARPSRPRRSPPRTAPGSATCERPSVPDRDRRSSRSSRRRAPRRRRGACARPSERRSHRRATG